MSDEGIGKQQNRFRGSNASGQFRLGGVSMPSALVYIAIGLFALLVLGGVVLAAFFLLPMMGGKCADSLVPVCGTDGNTYNSTCFAQKAGVTVKSNGSCVIPCTDSDGGRDIFVAGSASKGTVKTSDQCSGKGDVLESYCADNMVTTATIPCPASYECSYGACIKSSCIDSDGGLFKNVKGSVVFGNTNASDECASSSKVKEYYCKDNALASADIDCDSGTSCINGACVETPCKDTDNGMNSSVSGTVTKGSDTFMDKCDNVSVVEYYCENGSVKSQTMQCPSGSACNLGRCKEDTCSDSDGGMDQFTKGTVTLGQVIHQDSCYSTSSVIEYYCPTNKTTDVTTIPCGDGYECEDGRCKTANCVSSLENLDSTDEDMIIQDFGSSDPLTLRDNDVVRINSGYLLELYSISGNKSYFRLYRNISEYRDNNELCSLSIGIGNSTTSMCGKTINKLKVAGMADDKSNTTLQINGYYVAEYFSQNGKITDWTDNAACKADVVNYDSFVAEFFPSIDTDSSFFNLDNFKFRLFDQNATLKAITDSSVKFVADGRTYTLSDGDSFTYKDANYVIGLTFAEHGLRKIEINKD